MLWSADALLWSVSSSGARPLPAPPATQRWPRAAATGPPWPSGRLWGCLKARPVPRGVKRTRATATRGQRGPTSSASLEGVSVVLQNISLMRRPEHERPNRPSPRVPEQSLRWCPDLQRLRLSGRWARCTPSSAGSVRRSSEGRCQCRRTGSGTSRSTSSTSNGTGRPLAPLPAPWPPSPRPHQPSSSRHSPSDGPACTAVPDGKPHCDQVCRRTSSVHLKNIG